jgi:hypothetical protein
MGKVRGLSAKQNRVIDALENSGRTMSQILHDQRMTPRELGRWMAHGRFRVELRRLRRSLRGLRVLDLEIGATIAAGLMAKVASDPDAMTRELQRRVCVDLIRLSGTRRGARREPTNPFPHPEVTPQQAKELMEGLLGEPNPSAGESQPCD